MLPSVTLLQLYSTVVSNYFRWPGRVPIVIKISLKGQNCVLAFSAPKIIQKTPKHEQWSLKNVHIHKNFPFGMQLQVWVSRSKQNLANRSKQIISSYPICQSAWLLILRKLWDHVNLLNEVQSYFYSYFKFIKVSK